MHLNCPHCHNAIEIIAAPDPEEVLCPSCGSSFRLDGDQTPSWGSMKGRLLGRFRLERLVGTGAFGSVYRAHDPQLDRVVAVKIPRAGNLAGQDDLSRFLREGRSAAQLRDPGIVPVHEVGVADGLPYLVSEFVEGPSLADALTARELPPREAAELVARVADALHYAHARGVVHRDVKPSNILLDAGGRPRLMDFGLARRDAGEITMTLDGEILGTPSYMSPEQARGAAHEADGRSDVYSLGVILYRLLAGELPFRGNHRMLLHQVLHEEPRPPRKVNDTIPRDLETACLKALEKAPERRYATAGALADDLRRWCRGEPIQARPIGRIEKGWRWCRRRPALAATGAVAALALVAVSAASAAWALRERHFAREQSAAALAQARFRAEAERRGDAERVQRERADAGFYLTALPQAGRDLASGHIDRTRALLDQCAPGLRGWEWRLLDRICRDVLASCVGHEGPVTDAAWSPDGRTVATAGVDGTARIWDAATGRAIHVLRGHEGEVFALAFRPDGRALATGGRDAVLRIWDPQAGRLLREHPGPGSPIGALAFDPGGTHVAVGRWDGSIQVRDPEDARDVRDLDALGGAVHGLRYAPDGRRLAAAAFLGAGTSSIAHAARLYEADSGRALDLEGASSMDITFDPDGRRVRIGGFAWDAATGAPIGPDPSRSAGGRFAVLPGARVLAQGQACYFHPNANIVSGLAVASGRFGAGWLFLSDPTTGRPRGRLHGHSDLVTALAYQPDGRLLSASLDGTARIWRPGAGQAVRPIGKLPGAVQELRASGPAGGELSAFSDATAGTWDPATGRALSMARRAWAAASLDGSRVLHEVARGGLEVRDTRTGRALLGVAPAATERFIYRALDPRGGRLAILTVAADARVEPGVRVGGTVQVWDVDAARELGRIPIPQVHVSVLGWPGRRGAFSPDGRHLLLLAADGPGFLDPQYLILVDLAARPLRRSELRGYDQQIYAAAFSGDGTTLAVAGDGATVRLWDVASGRLRHVLRGHSNRILELAFRRDGRALASTSVFDRTMRAWDVPRGRPLQVFTGYTAEIGGVPPEFSPDGRLLAWARPRGAIAEGTGVGNPPSEIVIEDVASGRELLALPSYDGPVTALAFDPDGTRLHAGTREGVVVTFDAGDPPASFPDPEDSVPRPSRSPASVDGGLTFWDHGAPVRDVAFRPGDGSLASLGTDATLLLGPIAGGDRPAPDRLPGGEPAEMAFRPDGAEVAVVTVGGLLVITGLDPPGRRRTFGNARENGGLYDVAYSPDGTRVAVAGERGVIWIRDVESGAVVRQIPAHDGPIWCLAFRPDGRRLASAGKDGALKIWDPETGEAVRSLAGHGAAIEALAYSPDGTRLASAGWDNAVRLWDANGGAPVRSFEGHAGDVADVAFSPDGLRLASSGADDTVRLWDARTGALLATYAEHSGNASAVAFSPDGAWLASSSFDGTVEVRPLAPPDPGAAAPGDAP